MFKKYLDFILTQKGKEIKIYDITSEVNLCNFVIVQHFNSTLDNKKFADAFMAKFGLENFPEGYNRGEWIVFDLGETLVHSFLAEKREKYNLDKLWQNKRVGIDIVQAPAKKKK